MMKIAADLLARQNSNAVEIIYHAHATCVLSFFQVVAIVLSLSLPHNN